MKKISLLIHGNRLRVCFILVCVSLVICLTYSVIPGFFPARYPDHDGETYVRLDRTYYQIWGNSVQVHVEFSELYTDEPEPFEGDYYVLLVNTQEEASASIYNRTRVLQRPWRAENGTLVYYNTTVSVLTTPIKNVVTIGEVLSFNLTIEVQQDLLFEHQPLSIFKDLPKFRLKKGSNNIPTEIRFIQGDEPYQVLVFCKVSFKEGVFNFTTLQGYGYESVFDIRFFKSITGDDYEDLFLGVWGYNVWILPFSGRILQEEYINVEHGRSFFTFPLNTSLSANKMAFVRSSLSESYIIDISALTILLSPPITLPPLIVLIVSYAIYKKWKVLVSHLSKYKFLYASVLAGITLLVLLYSQAFPSPLAFAIFLLIPCMICMGFISIGLIKNGFTRKEHRSFWKKIIALTMLFLLYPLLSFVHYIISSGNTGFFIFYIPVYVTITLLFLGACLVGMIVNSLISFAAGFFLLASHLGIRVWHRVQGRSETSVFILNVPEGTRTPFSKSFYYYVAEFFLFSLWLVILLSSSVSVSVEDLWETILQRNILFLLIPLSAVVHLLLSFELLNVLWSKGKEKRAVGPKLLHKFWSAFAVMVFVAKIFLEGLSLSLLLDLGLMSYFLLLASSGFTFGFIGTTNVAMKCASKEIMRVAKHYRWIIVHRPPT